MPAQIDSIAFLIWRHPNQGQPALELQTARANLDRLIERIGMLGWRTAELEQAIVQY